MKLELSDSRDRSEMKTKLDLWKINAYISERLCSHIMLFYKSSGSQQGTGPHDHQETTPEKKVTLEIGYITSNDTHDDDSDVTVLGIKCTK